MKSVIIHQQIELRLESPKDSFIQGDLVPCILSIKNHRASELPPLPLLLELRYGDPKVVSEEGEIQLTASGTLSSTPAIAPGASFQVSHSFALDPNAAITEKNRSLYLSFGIAGMVSQRAPLTILPHQYLQGIYDLFESSFQFVGKGFRSQKGWTEAKFRPSAAPKYALVEELNCGARFEGTTLKFRFVFKVKKFNADQSSIQVRKEKNEIERSLELNEIADRDGVLRHGAVESLLQEVLALIA